VQPEDNQEEEMKEHFSYEREGKKIVIRFLAAPSRTTTRKLRAAGFQWSAAKRAWYGESTEDSEAIISATPSPDVARNTVILGDCIEVLKRVPDATADFVLTDPPYLVNYKDRTGRSIQNDKSSEWMIPAFEEIARVMKPDTLMFSFYGWQDIDVFMHAWKAAGLVPVDHIVCTKGYSSSTRYFHRCHEQAYLLAKGHPPKPDIKNMLEDVRRWKYTGNKFHPTQKPEVVLKDMIDCFCPKGGLVLDPFAGSASTCLAAKELGRDYLGIEIDEKYHAAAQGRLQ
jgi:site-specific DNA-methyltransferase (adenine-specific)